MIELETNMPRKKSLFGDANAVLSEHDIILGGNWDFHKGYFDTALHKTDDDAIYLRLPFNVLEGELDEDDAMIEFATPFIIRHMVNASVDDEDVPVLSTVGLDQFKKPDNPDAPIPDSERWVKRGEEYVAEFSDHSVFIV